MMKRFCSGLFLVAGIGLFCWGMLQWWNQYTVTNTVTRFLNATIAGDALTATNCLAQTPNEASRHSAAWQPLRDVRFRIITVTETGNEASVKVRLICQGQIAQPIFRLQYGTDGWRILQIEKFSPPLPSPLSQTTVPRPAPELVKAFANTPGVTVSPLEIHGEIHGQ